MQPVGHTVSSSKATWHTACSAQPLIDVEVNLELLTCLCSLHIPSLHEQCVFSAIAVGITTFNIPETRNQYIVTDVGWVACKAVLKTGFVMENTTCTLANCLKPCCRPPWTDSSDVLTQLQAWSGTLIPLTSSNSADDVNTQHEPIESSRNAGVKLNMHAKLMLIWNWAEYMVNGLTQRKYPEPIALDGSA